MNNFKFLFIVFFVYILMSNSVLANDIKYKDLPRTHWAFDAIQRSSQAGIVKGYPDNSFKPDQNVTREQFAIILVKYFKFPLNPKAYQIFSDVNPKHRSFLYIDCAKSFIPVRLKDYELNFYPGRAITREEVAQAIVKALELNKAQKPDKTYLSSKFRDYQSISPEFSESVAIAAYYGILAGDAERNFNSKAGLSRGQLCAIIDNLVQKKAIIDEGFKAPHKPWTIAFVNFRRPDYEMVQDFPDYNKIQSFRGKVTKKVLGVNNSHFVVSYPYEDDSYARITIRYLIVNIFVADKDLALFNIGDWVTFNYDRHNNVVSYSLNGKVYEISNVN